MGTPSTTSTTFDSARPESLPQDDAIGAGTAEPLAEITSILGALNRRDQQSVESASRLLQDRQDFIDEFHTVCKTEVRPAMEEVLERLRRDGGDGLIEDHPGGEARIATPRLTMWMSLQGAIAGKPRPDRHPYLQLDADADTGTIRLTEGDIWHGGGGGTSGSAGTWQLEEVNRTRVMLELLAIVRRSGRISPT
jgi:hypothetical protein